MDKKVTIKDIAYLSGVSIATVSRVISGKGKVNEDTKKIVQETVLKTGYEPNYTARALATKNSGTIAVMIDRIPSKGLNNSFFLEALDAIATNLNKYEKDMLLVFSSFDKSDEDQKVKKLVQSNKIDGIIKLSVQKNDKTLKYLASTNTPTVLIGRTELENIITVNNDNVNAMKEGVKFLISKGHKKIAFVSGSPDYLVTYDRNLGYKKALQECGLVFNKNDIFYTNFDIDCGYNVAKDIISKDYDAIACTDDLIAFGIAKKYKEKDKFIDIVSFNNSYFSDLSPFPINSIDINAKKLGKQSVELLLNNKNNIKNLIVDTNLIIRS